MHFLRRSLCSLTTTVPSQYLHFQPLKKTLYMLLFSRFSTSPNTPFGAKRTVDEHDWDKYWMKKRFDENDQRAGLESQYTCAVDKEEYENAVRLQVAITAATQDDDVGRVMSKLNKAIEEEHHEDATFLRNNTGAELVGWRAGVSGDHMYGSTRTEGIYNEQAVYLMHKVAPEDSLVAEVMKLDVCLSHLTPYPSQDLWAETFRKFSMANGKDNTEEICKDILAECGINRKFEGDKATKFAMLSAEEKAIIHHAFAVGGIVENAMLERKVFLPFSLSVDENNDQQRCRHKSGPFVLSHARNQQPLVSGITTFKQIEVPASSTPLNGLYIGSNAFPVTEAIQVKRRFGHWHEDGGIDNVLYLEPCEYAELVKLTGDSDVPAGQVAFRAQVGENYKLPPWSVLEKDFGVVARYKGQGRFTGFQKSGWVDVELFVLREKYHKDGFLYSAPYYYYMKCFKQTRPCFFALSQGVEPLACQGDPRIVKIDRHDYWQMYLGFRQLATAKDGTPLFEIYVSTSKEGKYVEQIFGGKWNGSYEREFEGHICRIWDEHED